MIKNTTVKITPTKNVRNATAQTKRGISMIVMIVPISILYINQ